MQDGLCMEGWFVDVGEALIPAQTPALSLLPVSGTLFQTQTVLTWGEGNFC